MKTPFIPKLILLFILFFLYSAGYAQQRDSVTIRGQVTDYNGQPIDSCSIFWQSPSFDDIKQAITDKNGYYTTRIPKGKYQSMGAINMSTYPHTVKPGLAEKDQRLEFWAWNFIADRDTTLNIRYHRMEVYGLRIFHIPGGMPTYQIYVRPMSLTRTLQWQKEEKSSLVHAQDLSKIEQTGLSKQAKYNPQIQISAESETKRSIFRKRDKTKRSKKESAQHSKSRNKSFVMTSVSAL